MFSDASSVLIGEKEVESIRLGSTVLYEKPSSVTAVNISVIWDDAGHESSRPSSIQYRLRVNDEYIVRTITSSENWQQKIEEIPINAELTLTLTANLRTYTTTITNNGYNFTVNMKYHR